MHPQNVVDFFPHLLIEPAPEHDLYAVLFVDDVDMLNPLSKMDCKLASAISFCAALLAIKSFSLFL
jgi:hypothetical protein